MSTKIITFVKLADRLENWLKFSENTQSSLARITGISQGAINNYLAGRIPKADELCKFADFFECSTDELLGRTKEVYQRTVKEIRQSHFEIRLEDAGNALSEIKKQVGIIEQNLDDIKHFSDVSNRQRLPFSQSKLDKRQNKSSSTQLSDAQRLAEKASEKYDREHRKP